MKQTIAEKQTIIKTVVKSITCNCCGKTISGNLENMADITNLNISFGYGSRFDNTTWDMDICDDCLELWVATFKHKIYKKSLY